jgi:hypothetical protein
MDGCIFQTPETLKLGILPSDATKSHGHQKHEPGTSLQIC